MLKTIYIPYKRCPYCSNRNYHIISDFYIDEKGRKSKKKYKKLVCSACGESFNFMRGDWHFINMSKDDREE